MILIDAQRLKFLLRGRYVTIVLNEDRRVWRKGRTYAVGVHHSKPAICRAQIIRVERQDDAKIALTLQHAHEDELRLLGKKGGYVTNVAAALPDEPEAVDERTQEKITEAAHARDKERRKEAGISSAAQPLSTRVERVVALKRQQRADITSELRIIEERLRRAERINRQVQEDSVRGNLILPAAQPLADNGGGIAGS